MIEFEKINAKNFFIKTTILAELKKQQFDHFDDFKTYCVQSNLQKIFTTNLKLNLSFEPKNYRELKNHSYEKQFKKK